MRAVYSILLTLCIFSCYDDGDFFDKRDPKKDPYIEFIPSEGAPANGTDTLRVNLKFPVDPLFDSVSAKFTVNDGVFYETNKPEYTSAQWYRDNDGKLTISCLIKTTTVRNRNLLTVEVSNLPSLTSWFWFLNAYPIDVIVDKSKFSVKEGATDEIQLFATVLSNKGVASRGTKVEFKVGDQSSESSKWFRGLTKTDEKGIASVYFSPGGLSKLGETEFQVIVKNAAGKDIIKQGVFYVVQ